MVCKVYWMSKHIPLGLQEGIGKIFQSMDPIIDEKLKTLRRVLFKRQASLLRADAISRAQALSQMTRHT